MDKKDFRTYCLSRQTCMNGKRKYGRDKRIINQLRQYILCTGAKCVMLYIPLVNEVNIMLLISMLRRKGVEVLVPFMEGSSFRLVRYRLPLEIKRFGVREPKYSKNYKIKMIDIAVVPIVGTDASLRRVGFGKGMYDRFFAQNIKNIDNIVFLARDIYYINDIITNNYDIKADFVLGFSIKRVKI